MPYDGVSLVLDLVVLQAVVGLGALAGRRARRAAVLGGIVLSLAFWVTGQGLGQFWSGISTDPNTAPLLILLGVTVLGAAPWRSPALQGRRPGPEPASLTWPGPGRGRVQPVQPVIEPRGSQLSGLLPAGDEPVSVTVASVPAS